MLDRNYGVKLDAETLRREREIIRMALEIPTISKTWSLRSNLVTTNDLEDSKLTVAADLLSMLLSKASLCWRTDKECPADPSEFASAVLCVTYITAAMELIDQHHRVWQKHHMLLQNKLAPQLRTQEAKYIEHVEELLTFAQAVTRGLDPERVAKTLKLFSTPEYLQARKQRLLLAHHVASTAINLVEQQEGRRRTMKIGKQTPPDLRRGEAEYLSNWLWIRRDIHAQLSRVESEFGDLDEVFARSTSTRILMD